MVDVLVGDLQRHRVEGQHESGDQAEVERVPLEGAVPDVQPGKGLVPEAGAGPNGRGSAPASSFWDVWLAYETARMRHPTRKPAIVQRRR